MHYAIGDVHGCYDQMIKLINKIKSQDLDAKIIFVGDFVDRGPKVWETLDWCLEHIDTSGDPDAEYRSVRGNHEQMLIDWFFSWVRLEYEIYPATHYDFDCRMLDRGYSKPDDVRKYIDFFERLPLYIDVETNEEKFKITHSWYPPEQIDHPKYLNEWYLWERMWHHYDNNYVDFTLIHGHTPTIVEYDEPDDTPGKICYRYKNINIDGGCVFNKKFKRFEQTYLCGYCLETGEEFYVPGPEDEDWRREI